MDILYVIIFCVIPLILINRYFYGVQKEFARLYREKIDPDELFYPDEINKKYRNRTDLFMKDAPRMLLLRLEIFWRDYKNKELNRVAYKLRLYFISMTLVIIFNFFFFSYLIMNS